MGDLNDIECALNFIFNPKEKISNYNFSKETVIRAEKFTEKYKKHKKNIKNKSSSVKKNCLNTPLDIMRYQNFEMV